MDNINIENTINKDFHVNLKDNDVIYSEDKVIADDEIKTNSDENIVIHSQIILKNPDDSTNVKNISENSEQNNQNTIVCAEAEILLKESKNTNVSEPQETQKNITENINHFTEINNVKQGPEELLSHISTESPSCTKQAKNIDLLLTNTKAITCLNVKNTSLGYLQSQYSNSNSDADSDSDSTSENNDTNRASDADSSDSEPVIVTDNNYRNQVLQIESDSSSSDSEVEFVHEDLRKKIIQMEEENEDDVENDETEEGIKKPRDPLRVKGELLIHELPPIQDLQITVPEEECVELGKVNSIVDQLVLVDSIPETVPLNLDTVLFLDKGQKVLGEVFDVIGQVTNPLYCVRFNSNKQIIEKGIQVGQTVYVAPRTEHTQFVILPELMKMRGSDASWKNDTEPSQKHIDFSDDEEERNYRRSLNKKEYNNRSEKGSRGEKRSRTYSSTSQISDSSSITTESTCYDQNFSNVRPGNFRFSRPYRHQYRQFQPRNVPSYINPHLQNPPAYNYDQHHNSWHSNFNFSGYNRNEQFHRQGHFQPQFNDQNTSNIGFPLILPNPYAVRPPYLQQPMYRQQNPSNLDK